MSKVLAVPVLINVLAVMLVAGAPQTPPTRFRSAIDLVALNVTVTDGRGRPVSNLSGDDFAVFEDGRPQQLSYFESVNTPLSVSLLMDVSSSMYLQMPLAKRAAVDFVSHLRPGDLAAVFDFDNRVHVGQTFTSDKHALRSAIEDLQAGGTTALYNAVYIALRQFDSAKPDTQDAIRRTAIVVLSDGEDTASLVTFDELLDVARRSQAAIYPIRLTDQFSGAWSMTGETAHFRLRQLAEDTGGRLLTAKRAQDLAGVYAEIRNELAKQYILGYVSNNPQRDGGWRRLTVRVQRPNTIARTRTGYYSPTS